MEDTKTKKLLAICAAVEYGDVHSDLCLGHGFDPSQFLRKVDESTVPEGEEPEEGMTTTMRELYHAALEEWLDNSNGQGAFWIGNVDYLREQFS